MGWLYFEKKFPPTKKFPDLKIPGLNSMIPEGCQYGFQPGGWGKPPLDEHGKPLYGDWALIKEERDKATSHYEREVLWGAMEDVDEDEMMEGEGEGDMASEMGTDGVSSVTGKSLNR